MATFSWSDTLKVAFKSCSSCLWTSSEDDGSSHINDSEGHNPAINNIPRSRPDELQGLLADVDTDVEAERMSLHSNPGVGSQRKRKKTRCKSKRTDKPRITLFGYNLFGRAPIQLADDSEDALYSRRGTLTPNTQSTSSSMFDSDAAPLGRDAIAALSSPTAAAAAIEAAATASAELEVQRLREKGERRLRRRQKKEMKRMAAALASQGIIGDGEFEGFQGSGGELHPQISRIMFSGSDSGSESRHSSQPAPNNDFDDTADLDGGLYSRKSTSNAGSDSRSRTSASMSDRVRQTSGSKAGQKKSTNNSSSSRTTTSQPTPLPSPRSLTFSQEAQVVSPSTIEQGQGFFDLEDEVDLHKQESSYIPITGFTGASGGRKNNVGVFLAQRGGGDNEGR